MGEVGSSSRGRDARAEFNPRSVGGREFLQERLALFGKWFFVAALAYYLVSNFPTDKILGYPFSWTRELFGVQELLELGVTLCAGVVWLVARGRQRSARALGALDAFGVVTPLFLLAAAVHRATPPRADLGELASILLGATNLVGVRAIVVPSSPRRTLVVGALGWLAVAAATAQAMAASDLPPRSASNVALITLLWGTLAVASGAMASRVLFRLRGEVAEALRLGPYMLQHKIGQGAMGVVYRASHALLRRPTAIKLLAPDKNSEADLRRFEREVRETARLTHPNTIAIYDFGRSLEGTFYYAMELVDGVSLEELVRRHGPLPAWRVVHILRQVCGALEEAHRMGLIHRDIKPANLMLCERGGQPDTVKVVDFGLVRPLAGVDGDGAHSQIDAAVGTPLFMAPEAFERPGELDERCDLYALGATAYFLLTGTPVFSGGSVVAICGKHLSQQPEPPSSRLGRPVPADLEALVLRCLAKRPADRPSAAELADLLARCADASGWSPERVASFWAELRAAPPPAADDDVGRAMTLARSRAEG